MVVYFISVNISISFYHIQPVEHQKHRKQDQKWWSDSLYCLNFEPSVILDSGRESNRDMHADTKATIFVWDFHMFWV